MSNEQEEIKPKAKPNYELVQANENNRLAVIRKIQEVDFKLDDMLNFIAEAESDKAKSHAMVEYNDSIIANVKGFHPEIAEYYESLTPAKQTAFLVFAHAVKEREGHVFLVKGYKTEIEKYQDEIKEIEEALNLKSK